MNGISFLQNDGTKIYFPKKYKTTFFIRDPK